MLVSFSGRNDWRAPSARYLDPQNTLPHRTVEANGRDRPQDAKERKTAATFRARVFFSYQARHALTTEPKSLKKKEKNRKKKNNNKKRKKLKLKN